MTTIVTTASNNAVTVCADRGITSDLIHPDMSKLVVQDTWIIAVAGDSRICDQLQYAIQYPKPPKDLDGKAQQDWYAFVVTKVIPLIEDTIKDKEMDAEAILITHGHSFHLTSNLAVLSASPYWAIGTGAELALGALATSQYNPDWNKNHDIIARHAIGVATMHDPNTRGTVDLITSHHTGKVIHGVR